MHPRGAQHLHQQQAGAAGGRVHERPAAGSRRPDRVHEVVRGHALEHGGGGDLVGDRIGHTHERAGGRDHALGVRARRRRPGDAVAGSQPESVRTHGLDAAGAFQPRDEGKRPRVQTRPEVDVDEVDAGGSDANPRLARAGRSGVAIDERQRLGTAGLFDDDRFRHGNEASRIASPSAPRLS